MAQDRLPTWPAISPDELAATYRRHATMARWLCDQAPARCHRRARRRLRPGPHARVAGQDTRSALADCRLWSPSNAAATHWVASPPRRDHHLVPTSTETSATTSTASARPPATPDPNTSRHCLAPSPNASPKSNAGRPRPEPSRRIAPDGTSPAQPTLGPEPADPEQRAHWDKTVAIVGTAGFLNRWRTRTKRGSERASLAARWENIHAVDDLRDNDRDVERSQSPLRRRYGCMGQTQLASMTGLESNVV